MGAGWDKGVKPTHNNLQILMKPERSSLTDDCQRNKTIEYIAFNDPCKSIPMDWLMKGLKKKEEKKAFYEE